jgi:heptosyltransferase-2
MTSTPTKPRLLIIELWGLGDLAIATPFLQAAVHKYDVTIVAKPYAKGLQSTLWPEAKVLPFVAPWTAFRRKYRLQSWPWREMIRIGRIIRAMRFDLGLSARWDPRDHFLLAFSKAKRVLGYPRMGSRLFLTESLDRPDPAAHRYENWRTLGQAIGLEIPPREHITVPHRTYSGTPEILVHTGAGHPIRVWPLESYRALVARLRQKKYRVQVVCDPDQHDWWIRNGEAGVATPRTVADLLALLDRARVMIGNDSGPGHLAAFAGVPTFTIFGPQLPEWFVPLHPAAVWSEGRACPYKPCWDYCRFKEPICLTGWTEPEIWARIEPFVKKITDAQ